MAGTTNASHHLKQPIRKKIGSTQISRYRKRRNKVSLLGPVAAERCGCAEGTSEALGCRCAGGASKALGRTGAGSAVAPAQKPRSSATLIRLRSSPSSPQRTSVYSETL